MTILSLVFPLLRPRLKLIDRLFARAERNIALIARCRPSNAAAEEARLLVAWRAGKRELPRFRYCQVPDLSELRRDLHRVCAELPETDPISGLYVERALELILESEIVEKIGTKELAVLAAQRFSASLPGANGRVSALAEDWGLLSDAPAEPVLLSHDLSSADSLVTRMQACVGQLKLPVRVELTDVLTAAAATGERTIFVARDRWLTKAAADRIVYHEVYGHALPRYLASHQELGLFAVGTAGGNDEQEGYALWLESVAGLMDNARKRELAFRHWAGLTVQDGADFAETVSTLVERGAELSLSLQIAARAHRAGGLAREVVYLPSYCRIQSAIEAEPELKLWLSSGRLSLKAVSVLRNHYELNSATTGM